MLTRAKALFIADDVCRLAKVSRRVTIAAALRNLARSLVNGVTVTSADFNPTVHKAFWADFRYISA